MHSGMHSPTMASDLWDRVAEFTKAAAEKGMETAEWGFQLSSALNASGESIPSQNLAQALVSYIFWSGFRVPAAWKYLDWALSSGLAPFVTVLAQFSTLILPYRRSIPLAYKLYMEIIKRHVSKLAPEVDRTAWERILLSVDAHLHLSETFGIVAREQGVLMVELVLYIVWQLVDASLEDEGLIELTPEKKSRWLNKPQDMEIDGEDTYKGKKTEFPEKSWKSNTVMSIEVVAMLLQHKLISGLLCLARQNMSSHWKIFTFHLQLLATNSLAMRNSGVSPDTFLHMALSSDIELCRADKCSQYRKLQSITSVSLSSLGGLCHGTSHSSLWIPLDLYLEDCIDISVSATNAIEIIISLVKTLQAMNRTTWHDAFMGLWVAALRLVQRERDPIEGPVPHVDTRLCLLLSITTLSIADIIREEEINESMDSRTEGTGECRKALMSSIQALGNYESLLVPPQCLVSSANQAAAKAMLFISEFSVSGGYFENIAALNEKTLDYSGNMWHLIVEACIARNLLETSAYFWPGYVSGRIGQLPHAMPSQGPGWSTLMKGASLTNSMVNVLVKDPASSLGELEKIVQIAGSGSDEDRISAATILCGASLIRGWNFQEYTVRFVVKLLSPPIPIDYSGTDSHLMIHAPVLFVILSAISTIDCVQVFSFHGLVPELAGALMAICEVFGSCISSSSWTLSSGEEVTVHAVFSNAFVLLLRLWKFNHPPLEYCIMGDGAPVSSQLTPHYLLLLRNSYVLAQKPPLPSATDTRPIFVDSFPKLKIWYMQHQACLASALSGLVSGTPVHRNVDSLLGMMFWKLSRGGCNQSVSGNLSNSNSAPGIEESSSSSSSRPRLPAWDIMEAVPFVVDAALTACSHSQLSPRELATGLKDLADFLPASLAAIVSYFSAEVTRGVWDPASMNGTDWPSPAANLSYVEDQIKKIVADTGVHVPSLVTGSTKATLPLPIAAFVSLTITYKLDSASVRFLDLAGPALENLAASCPWPCMPIVAALWTKKVKRWSDFLTFSASRTVFYQNNNAMVQLLRSCFHATLTGGVGGLLGHGFRSPVAPGVLYLRIYRCIKDILRLTEQILSLLVLSLRKNPSPHPSLVAAAARVRVAASLAASFAWLAGGSRVVQSLFQEMLPSWFLATGEGALLPGVSISQENVDHYEMLEGYAIAYFAVLCGLFAWGGSVRKKRKRVMDAHLEFVQNALDGRVSLRCSGATWRGYVVGFLGILAECAPGWIEEIEPGLLQRICTGLRRWGEHDLAFTLLVRGGVPAMGAAADLLISLSSVQDSWA